MNPQTPYAQPPAPMGPMLPRQSKKPLMFAIVFGLLFVAAAVFGYWAFSGRQDYKNNSDKKVADAVAAAEKSQAAQLQTQFTQQSKQPYKTYTGSATYGSINFNYPKNWSAYVDETGSGQPIEGYFYPNQVPGINGGTAFALRVELVNTDYSSVISNFQGKVQQGQVRASAYTPPKMNGVANTQIGTRFDGAISQDSQGNNQNGSMVVLKVRDKTLQIYTESNDYLSDFNNTILASLSYKP
ncbi:MAG TPA: hypothetical protein VFT49_02140 [Candidatus Saccharimonadales bacterium]|nr:hypothetical protein [Candidatus Saccharimonadales bacterium]